MKITERSIRKFVFHSGLLVFGVGMIVLGIIILSQGRVLLEPAAIIGGLVLATHGIHYIINYVSNNDNPRYIKIKRNAELISGIINIAVAIIIFILPNLTIHLLQIAFTVYVFLNAVVKLFDYIIYLYNKISGRIYDLISCIFFFVFGILMVFVPDWGYRAFLIVAGTYCIAYGVCVANDFFMQIIPKSTKDKFTRRLRISTPVFISTFFPLSMLRRIKSEKEINGTSSEAEIVYKEDFSGENQPESAVGQGSENAEGSKKEFELGDINVKVLIHISDDGVGKMGHCDLIVDNEVISYGNYDETTYLLARGIGDGIMFTCKPEAYIRYSVTRDKKLIFVYGIQLSEQQLKNVRDEIATLKKDIFVWKPPYQLAREANPTAKLADYPDYCSRLWSGSHATFYKFMKGRFKTYFVMSTNCVLLTDHIMGKAGADIVKLSGIITPGSYFNYLQGQLNKPGSMVIMRKIYSKENTNDWEQYIGSDIYCEQNFT